VVVTMMDGRDAAETVVATHAFIRVGLLGPTLPSEDGVIDGGNSMTT